MASNPQTPGYGVSNSIFAGPSNPNSTPTNQVGHHLGTPGSNASSAGTFLMPSSPFDSRRNRGEPWKPQVLTTQGQRPASLVNASVTYCGDNVIYAFGGFDQFTDEVYNHVLKLDITTLQWTLVDNYGDIPGVRMGHTATLYQGDKLIIYGGENEHRSYLSDIVIFDLKTAHWTQPTVTGPIPQGRARHAAVLHDDKLFIVGGLAGHSNYVLEDLCYLDLKTWTWSKTWKFVGRFDHTAWIWGGRMWVFGGLNADMDRGAEIWWLDLRGIPSFDFLPPMSWKESRPKFRPSPSLQHVLQPFMGNTPYVANSSSSVQTNPLIASPHPAGAVSSIRFVSGPNLPSQTSGTHFHLYSAGQLLDIATPILRGQDSALSSLELDTLRWQKLSEGADLICPGYRWQYCTMNPEGTKAWVLGSPESPLGNVETQLSHVLQIDLCRFGLIGNTGDYVQSQANRSPFDNMPVETILAGVGADLASVFNRRPEEGTGTDFIITSEIDKPLTNEEDNASYGIDSETAPPIYVHKMLLQARWPHFQRVYNSQMSEFHTHKMHIPEPYSVVRAFLYYLYTDSINPEPTPARASTLDDIAGLLVMSNVYDLPLLRDAVVYRLARSLDIEHAAFVWERSSTANEDWLRKRAAKFCHTHWGRVVRTEGFKRLSSSNLLELCEEADVEARVLSQHELEKVGGLGGAPIGGGGTSSTMNGLPTSRYSRYELMSTRAQRDSRFRFPSEEPVEDPEPEQDPEPEADTEVDEDDGMEMN
ncbi:MAG: hypothetical protein M1829_005216 [Trizodia sp. TS-e1964]|nr:MAG: hypothetical protein M1829_005216 [Trizodia sp. TS-e1964]